MAIVGEVDGPSSESNSIGVVPSGLELIYKKEYTNSVEAVQCIWVDSARVHRQIHTSRICNRSARRSVTQRHAVKTGFKQTPRVLLVEDKMNLGVSYTGRTRPSERAYWSNLQCILVT